MKNNTVLKNNTTLYNVMFPIWFLFIFPAAWLIMLPVNFVIDSIVLLLTAKVCSLAVGNVYKKSIIKVWLFGFAADLVGAGIIFLSMAFEGSSFWREYIADPVAYNPWDNWYAVLYIFIAFFISAVLIYLFNSKISFKKLEIPTKQKRIMALALAIFTAPYLFFVPSQLLYSQNAELQFFTNHIIPKMQYDAEITYTELETGDNETAVLPNYKGYAPMFMDGINTAKRVQLTEQEVNAEGFEQAVLHFYNSHQDYGETVVKIWFSAENEAVYFAHDDDWYRFKKSYAEKALAAWQDILAGGLGIPFEIVDEAELNDLLVPQALEKVYEDSEYTYYLSSTRSQYIFIEYFDDISGMVQRVDLVKALHAGIVTIEQLREKGLDIIDEPKK